MTDRTDIACMIAEWWHTQKAKNRRKDEINGYEEFIGKKYQFANEETDLIDSTVIIERFLKVESLSPLKLSEDYSQLTIRRPDGKKCIIQKFREPGGEIQKKSESVILTPPASTFQDNHCCNTCKYEDYYLDGIDKELYGKEISFNRRECRSFNPEAISYFKDHIKITLSKGEIPPVIHCPFWKQINGVDKKIKNSDIKQIE